MMPPPTMVMSRDLIKLLFVVVLPNQMIILENKDGPSTCLETGRLTDLVVSIDPAFSRLSSMLFELRAAIVIDLLVSISLFQSSC